MGSYRALLVANSKFYEDPTLLELNAPIYDMTRMQEALTHPTTGIFSKDRVELLPNARCADMLLTMENFFQSCEQDDTLLLYYSGHGKLDIFNAFFLCASDTRLDRLIATAIRDDQVNAMMHTSPARSFVLVLDCCSSGAWKGTKELLPEPLKGKGRFLITSSRPGQNSQDAAVRTESSPFTRYLVEAITEAEVDHDVDGYVDIDEIYRYVERSLKEAGPQQAQRGFDEASGTVALARRPLTPGVREEPKEKGPVGPTAPPSLNVTPERIDVTDIRSDDLPVFERIFVFNRGGGDLEWRAESDEAWIGLEQFEDFVRVKLEPGSPGTNKGTVYVREIRGAVERVPVRVEIDLRHRARSRFWERAKRPLLAAGAILGAVALVMGTVIALTSDRDDDGGDGGGGGPVPTEMVLAWHHERVDPAGESGRIDAINGTMAAGTLNGDAARWALTGDTWVARTDGAQGDQAINGLPPFGDSFVGVGETGTVNDQDAAAWRVSTDGVTPIPAAALGGPGNQAILRASPAIGRGLVAVGYDGADAAVWVFDGDGWEQVPDESGALGGEGSQVMLRVQKVKAVGGQILIAVGYESDEVDEDGAVWIATDPEGRDWERVPGEGAPFAGQGDQRIVDVGASSGRLIAVGYAESDAGDLDAAFWVSADGRTWTRGEPASELGGPGDQIITRVMAGIRTDLPSIIATGNEQLNGSMNSAVWYSNDGGETWVKQRITGTGLGGPGDQEPLSFYVQGSAVVVVGQDDGFPAIWRGRCAGHYLCS